MNCKRRFCCFTAYWTSNNGGFMPGWNPSGLAVAGIPSSPIFSHWIPIPSPGAVSSYSIATSLLAALAAAAAAEHLRKKTPPIIACLEDLLDDDTAGDPITGLKWSRRTTAKIAEALAGYGIC